MQVHGPLSHGTRREMQMQVLVKMAVREIPRENRPAGADKWVGMAGVARVGPRRASSHGTTCPPTRPCVCGGGWAHAAAAAGGRMRARARGGGHAGAGLTD